MKPKSLTKILQSEQRLVQFKLHTKYEAFNTGAIIERKLRKYRFRLSTLDWLHVCFFFFFLGRFD